MKEFSVQLWGSDPETDNCASIWASEDYTNLQDAQRAFDNPDEVFGNELSDSPYIEIVRNSRGEDCKVYCESLHLRKRMTDKEISDMEQRWAREARRDQREFAMELGMGLGCQAYNDAMGF